MLKSCFVAKCLLTLVLFSCSVEAIRLNCNFETDKLSIKGLDYGCDATIDVDKYWITLALGIKDGRIRGSIELEDKWSRRIEMPEDRRSSPVKSPITD